MLPVTRSDNAMADMAKVMEKVRGMRDSQLADVLAGKDMSIPQYAAMAEAMGRRQLRDAVKGAEAQQQAKQPTVKDQLLMADAQEAGLASLPAQNLTGLGEGHAAGGIIAFNDGGDVPRFYGEGYVNPNDFGGLASSDSPPGYGFSFGNLGEFGRAVLGGEEEWQKAMRLKRNGIQYVPPKGFDAEGLPIGSRYSKQTADQPGDYPVTAEDIKKDAEKLAAIKDSEGSKGAKGAPASSTGAPAGLNYLLAGSKFERRASPFGSFSPEEVDYNKLKDQGMGEGLMKMGAGLLSAPGSKGFAAGIQALAESGAVSRKEIAGLKKDARDYKLNVAKAEEAFNQGQDELGFKYMENANLNKYRMASLAQEPPELRTIRALAADPTLAAYAKGSKGVMSITDATKEFNDMAEKNPAMYRELKKLGVTTPRDYLTYATTGLPPGAVSATVPEGAKTRS